MRRLVEASAGAFLGTAVGLLSAVIVTRGWSAGAAAAFFLAPAVIVFMATIGELGLGVLSLHDVARLSERDGQQAYVNAVLLRSAARGVIAAAVTFVVAAIVLPFDRLEAAGVAGATWWAVVAIAGQPLLRGLDRRWLASVGGMVGATICTGALVVLLRVAAPDAEPLVAIVVGYSLCGLLTMLVLYRRRVDTAVVDHERLALRRSGFAAANNVANVIGRQFDTWLASWFVAAAAFTSYTVTVKMVAPLGLLGFAANQAAARDMASLLDGDPSACRHSRRVHRTAALLAGIGAGLLVAIGPTAGELVFGSAVDIERSTLAILAVGFVVSVVAGPNGMLLAAGERTASILLASGIALAVALPLAGVAAVAGRDAWVAPVFISSWLAVQNVLSAHFVHDQLGRSSWVWTLGHPVQTRSDRP